MSELEVVDAGPLTSVQDAVGRRRWRHLGVPVGGAADPWSARLSNRLVGNPDDAGLLEATFEGVTVRLHEQTWVAVTGGLRASVDGLPLPLETARRLRPGSTLVMERGEGLRGYLALAGGIALPRVLGSVATDLRGGFGGFQGRALRSGDRLPIGPPMGPPMRAVARGPLPAATLRLLPGLHPGMDRLLRGTWSVAAASDRSGLRLEEAMEGGGETDSVALPLGAVQLPPDGRPIILLADRPVTGGYLVPAVVIGADIGRAAQLRPGDPLRFASVSHEEAVEAVRQAEEELAALEPLGERGDDELGWAGSHE